MPPASHDNPPPPTIELFQPGTWRRRVAAAVTAFFPQDTRDYLKSIPGDEMYADTLEYLEQAAAATGIVFGTSHRQELTASVLRPFQYFRSYHACRPISFDGYRRDGLLPLTRERLAELAHVAYDGLISLEELKRRAATADMQTRLGNVYFSAEAEELVSLCGHYLIYGSEALCCLWKDSAGQTDRQYWECKTRSSQRGIPTVFTCDVPVEWLPEEYREALASTLVTHYLQLRSDEPFPVSQWSRNWGYSIARDLPARYLRGHFHPTAIPDPLRSMSVYRNPHLNCSWCSEDNKA